MLGVSDEQEEFFPDRFSLRSFLREATARQWCPSHDMRYYRRWSRSTGAALIGFAIRRNRSPLRGTSGFGPACLPNVQPRHRAYIRHYWNCYKLTLGACRKWALLAKRPYWKRTQAVYERSTFAVRNQIQGAERRSSCPELICGQNASSNIVDNAVNSYLDAALPPKGLPQCMADGAYRRVVWTGYL